MKKSTRLLSALVMIENTLASTKIQKALAQLNFTKQDILAGQALCQKVQMLEAAQQKEFGERYLATDQLKKAREDAWKMYIKHVECARYALKDPDLRGYWTILDIAGSRQRDLFGWLAQARNFYDNVDQVIPTLKKYNVTEAELKQGKSVIASVLEAYHRREKEAGEAKTSTDDRDQALQDLAIWRRRFTKTAKLALADDPQQLNVLGLGSKVGV